MNYEENEIFQLIMKSGLFTGSSLLLLNELVKDIEKVKHEKEANTKQRRKSRISKKLQKEKS